jgi:SSS family solute:Na+ symporter
MVSTDYILIGAYFVAVAAIGVWSSKSGRQSSRDYFLGGSGIGWMAIGASLFASNISAEHFIGLAGSGAKSGLAVGQFEWLACLILLLLGWVFVPHYLRTGVYTMPEFLERRFGSACRSYLALVTLVAYIFTKVSVAVYAGALVLETMLGWNRWVGAIALISATGLYTVFGGLRAVIYTDFMQSFVLVAGGIALTLRALAAVGGGDVLLQKLPAAHFSVWLPASHGDFPWTGILFGAPILGIWYWCTDQMIVQRTLAAPDIARARRATLFAGFLKVLPVFILVLPGLAGGLLFPTSKPDALYAVMVKELLPAGLRGLVVAGLLAALMSSLSSVFNSASTLVVIDFYKRRRPDASEAQLVRAGQLATVGLVLIGLLWLPFIGLMSDQLYVYLQAVQAYISPPIAAVFLLGIADKRLNSRGALGTLYFGLAAGAVRFVGELLSRAGKMRWALLEWLVSINFLHFATLSFVASIAFAFVLSRSSAPPSADQIAFLQRSSRDDDARATIAETIPTTTLLLVVALLWVVFSPLVF